MKAKTYFFRSVIALLTFLFSIGVYAVWYNLQENTNTHQRSITVPQIELMPSVSEIDDSNHKFAADCCSKQTDNVTVSVKRFVSLKGDKCYRYTVKNNTNFAIQTIDIGLDSTDSTELNTLPKGWFVDELGDGGAVEASNSTSMVEAYLQEESDQIYITPKLFWVEPEKSGSFDVCMKGKWDSSYQTSSWSIYKYDCSYSSIKGKLKNLDSKLK